ncbi:MAG: hypothetical protein OXC55_00545 [Chloroflexi bacterium]|nr:hypothetical protein [Chloroflexota bacterium]
MSTLGQVRERVRRDLHDEDANSYRWTDDVLNRHIERALAKVSKVAPHEKTVSRGLTDGSREVSVADLTDRVVVEAVEYPVGRHPPSRVRFNQWGDTLLLNLPGEPNAGESVTVYYGALHRLTDSASTLPEALEELVITGAAAYAALEWAAYAVNRLNVGGQDVWRQYLTWAEERMADFELQLARIGRRSGFRPRKLFHPEDDGEL